MMLQNDLAWGIEQKSNVKEALGKLRLARFGRGYQVTVKFLSNLPQQFCLFARNIDGNLLGILLMIPVEDLVGKAWRAPSGITISRTGKSRPLSQQAAVATSCRWSIFSRICSRFITP